MKDLFPISVFTIIVLFSIYQNYRIWDRISDDNQFTHQVIIDNKKLIKQLTIKQKELIQPLEKQNDYIIQNQKMMIMTIDTIQSDLMFFK
ncbi:uncharacterized protein METZ01_LOCUS299719 [marine metagenome]|jgi:hypothetical protein|uniref:Uncharacterized protein n=1 Tax=marine metagenome TaxID=408172 RepID=A0A382MFL5_9ZZZZ|tara:strand:+ start:602 stop:871 length:270 start_codon:yes stop_codon:yes gene_type:complete